MRNLSNKNKLLLALNPVSGKGLGKRKLYETVEAFSKFGYRVTVLLTEPDGVTERKIAEEAGNYEKVVAVGGDGTLNAVANGLIRSGTDTPMGYIPLGSANDFGSSLGLSNNIDEVCEKIATYAPKNIDVGRCGDRYFVYIMCTGLFTSTSYTTSQQMKNVMGHNAYVLKGISELVNAKKTQYTIELDDEVICDNFAFVSVSSTLRIGGVLTMPKDEVRFDDGLFELLLIKYPNTIIDGNMLANDLFYSNLTTDRFVRRKISKAKIHFAEPQGWSLDGEDGGKHNDISIEVKEKALRLIY